MKNFFTSKTEEEICPNCGTVCLETDILCSGCGEKLDELFEQIPLETLEKKTIISLKKEHKLLLKWVLATAIGFALGDLLLSPLAFMLVPYIPSKNGVDLYLMALGLAKGIAVGTSQWVILKKYISYSWQWIIATSVGMISGNIVTQFFFLIESHYLPIEIGLAIYPIDVWLSLFIHGVLVGFSQWIVLQQHIHKAWTWILANGFSWAVAITIGMDVISPIFYPVIDFVLIQYAINPFGEIVISGTIGSLMGIITGIHLLWFFKQNNIVIENIP